MRKLTRGRLPKLCVFSPRFLHSVYFVDLQNRGEIVKALIGGTGGQELTRVNFIEIRMKSANRAKRFLSKQLPEFYAVFPVIGIKRVTHNSGFRVKENLENHFETYSCCAIAVSALDIAVFV